VTSVLCVVTVITDEQRISIKVCVKAYISAIETPTVFQNACDSSALSRTNLYR
jgi:hypothetical protein